MKRCANCKEYITYHNFSILSPDICKICLDKLPLFDTISVVYQVKREEKEKQRLEEAEYNKQRRQEQEEKSELRRVRNENEQNLKDAIYDDLVSTLEHQRELIQKAEVEGVDGHIFDRVNRCLFCKKYSHNMTIEDYECYTIKDKSQN